MATADSVKTKIQNLITSANNTTGQSDGDMTSAVESLISGFGGSGIPVITGIYVTEERRIADIEFSTPGGVSNFVIFLLDPPSFETAEGFCVSYAANKDGNMLGAGSNNSGTAVSAGGCFGIEETVTGYYYRIVFGPDSVTMVAPTSTAKNVRTPQAGKRYQWIAW